jgi:ABC-type multidrug transport system fused ATPase/permease subunit
MHQPACAAQVPSGLLPLLRAPDHFDPHRAHCIFFSRRIRLVEQLHADAATSLTVIAVATAMAFAAGHHAFSPLFDEEKHASSESDAVPLDPPSVGLQHMDDREQRGSCSGGRVTHFAPAAQNKGSALLQETTASLLPTPATAAAAPSSMSRDAHHALLCMDVSLRVKTATGPRQILRAINAVFRAGELTALMGMSGAGKVDGVALGSLAIDSVRLLMHLLVCLLLFLAFPLLVSLPRPHCCGC